MYHYVHIRACAVLSAVGVPDFAAGAMENWGLITFRYDDTTYHTPRNTKYYPPNGGAVGSCMDDEPPAVRVLLAHHVRLVLQ